MKNKPVIWILGLSLAFLTVQVLYTFIGNTWTENKHRWGFEQPLFVKEQCVKYDWLGIKIVSVNKDKGTYTGQAISRGEFVKHTADIPMSVLEENSVVKSCDTFFEKQ